MHVLHQKEVFTLSSFIKQSTVLILMERTSLERGETGLKNGIKIIENGSGDRFILWIRK